ncbi:unnamed protein product, partial [Echinostoma caproni]|uniref:Nonstructural protein n=1 Tax=Echinostoma caproni TaxID=27848 RepID=A0A183BCU8_9TREM
PVVEEEEEEDYEDEDVVNVVGATTADDYLRVGTVGSSEFGPTQPMSKRGSLDSETNTTNGRDRSSVSITGATGTSDSSQSREFQGIGDIPTGTDAASNHRKKRKRAPRKTDEVAVVVGSNSYGLTEQPKSDNPLV